MISSFSQETRAKRLLDCQNSQRRGNICHFHRQHTSLLDAFLRGGLHGSRRWKRKEDRLEKKDAVRSIFQWSSKKRSRTTLGSKGKRKGESSEKTKEETLEKNLSAMWKEAWCHRETTNWSSGKKQHSWKNLEIKCRITKMKTKSASMLAPWRRINWTCTSVFLPRIFLSKTNIFGFTLVSYPGMNFYICF